MTERIVGLVGLVLVALALIVGTFVLLSVGRPVPEPIWVAWGVVTTALFGHGVFLAQAQTHQRVVSALLDAVNVGAGAATGSQSGGPTNGAAHGGAETSNPAPPAPPGTPGPGEVSGHGV